MGAVVQGGIDIGECPLFRLHLGCQPPLDGFGRLYVSLQTPSVPALTGYVFFRPGNAPLSNGSYIRLAGDAGGFFEDAADYSYSRGPLNHAQPDLVFDIGTAGLSGFTVIFETLYLEDGGPASMARAERLQQVTVDFR